MSQWKSRICRWILGDEELSEAPSAATASYDVTAQRLRMRLYIPWTDRDLALFRDFLSGFPVIPKFHLYGRRNSFLLAFSFSNKINDIFKKHVSTVLMSSSILNNTKYKVEFKVCDKMLIGQNKQQQRENNVTMHFTRKVSNYMVNFMIILIEGCSHWKWIASLILIWKVINISRIN